MDEASPLQICTDALPVRILQIVLGGLALLLAFYGFVRFRGVDGDRNPTIQEERDKIISSTVAGVAVLVWPLLWDALVGYGVLVHHPITMFGFFWPMLTSLLDMYNSSSARKKCGVLQGDANALIGIAFAIGTLLMATKQSRSFVEATSPLLMYALLLLIAFVVPTSNSSPDNYIGTLTGSLQKAFFNYAMGFIITGITMNVSSSTGLSLKTTLSKVCQ